MFHRRRRSLPQINRPRYRVNQYIRVPEIQVIDDQGKPLGILPTWQALQLAQEQGFDLVEVDPTSQPPIAKILDYGQFQYKQQKQQQAQKSKVKKVDIKGIRLSLKIGEHDRQIRLTQAQRFLDEGNKVRLEIILRGREKAHADLARELMQKFVTDLGTGVVIEAPLARMGGNINMQVGKKKS